MKHKKLMILSVFLFPLLASAQVPTFVQHASCPNSNAYASGVEGIAISLPPTYKCPLPEASQAGNTLVMGFRTDNTGSPTWTITDDGGDTWTRAATATDSAGFTISLYYATGIAANTHFITAVSSTGTSSTGPGFVAMTISEFAFTGTPRTSSCFTAISSSTTITNNTQITPTSGDLLWQWVANTSPSTVNSSANSVTAFSPGSGWTLLGTDLWDGDASQYQLAAGSAITPLLTQTGTARTWDSCAVDLAPSAAGSLPTKTFRIVHMSHQQEASSGPDTQPMEFPSSGNLLVMSYIAGGNFLASVTSPGSTWEATGPCGSPCSGSQAISQMYYAPNAATSNTLQITANQSGSMTGTGFMLYDIVGAATSSPLDKDSGVFTGQQKSGTSVLMCSTCLTPTAANDLIVANIGNAWCTGTSVTSSLGGIFDTASYSGNSNGGPQSVDQNNGWMHLYDATTAAVSNVTFNYSCQNGAQSSPEAWSGRVAAFSAANSMAQQPAPPTQLKATVN